MGVFKVVTIILLVIFILKYLYVYLSGLFNSKKHKRGEY